MFVRAVRCLALWVAVALPFSPSIFSVTVAGWKCFRPELGFGHPAERLAMMIFGAPIILLMGPIAHDEDLQPTPCPMCC